MLDHVNYSSDDSRIAFRSHIYRYPDNRIPARALGMRPRPGAVPPGLNLQQIMSQRLSADDSAQMSDTYERGRSALTVQHRLAIDN